MQNFDNLSYHFGFDLKELETNSRTDVLPAASKLPNFE